MKYVSLFAAILFIGCTVNAQMALEQADRSFKAEAAAIDAQVIEWRHHLHQNPELSNREFKTAAYIESHLRSLGLEVQTGVAKTGVVGILKGKYPGPVIGLRADMDGLPVLERTDVPFKSMARGEYKGEDVPVMHACGHDTHVAMLMGAATVLTGMKDELRGTVKFVFQPAEEGAPPGEEGGAKVMIEEGVMKNPDVDVMFGIHINSLTEVGKVRFKPGGTMAASDAFTITVKGVQTHGSMPWGGVDPITTSAHIILGLQSIISRQTELTKEAAVISVGKITSGVRNNIIPEEAEMIGTIRTLDTKMQDIIHEKIKITAENIARSQGAEAIVDIRRGYPVTHNDPELTAQMLPTLKRVFDGRNVILSNAVTGAEDFSYYAREVPGFFVFLGGRPATTSPKDAAPHHTPDFYVDDSALKYGVELFCSWVWDYSNGAGQ